MELYNQAADIVGPKVQIGYDPKDGVYMYLKNRATISLFTTHRNAEIFLQFKSFY